MDTRGWLTSCRWTRQLGLTLGRTQQLQPGLRRRVGRRMYHQLPRIVFPSRSRLWFLLAGGRFLKGARTSNSASDASSGAQLRWLNR